MKIGFDYWQVISHYPIQMGELMSKFATAEGNVHVISAIGKRRAGTIEREVTEALAQAGWDFGACLTVHEVIFDSPSQSPALKLAKCRELGIQVFYDDRDDVCRLLCDNGILALRVTRRDTYVRDVDAERS